MSVVVVVAVWSIATVWDMTTNPVFFMSEPTVVPVVFLIVPALIGPEKVVVPMLFSCLGLSVASCNCQG